MSVESEKNSLLEHFQNKILCRLHICVIMKFQLFNLYSGSGNLFLYVEGIDR